MLMLRVQLYPVMCDDHVRKKTLLADRGLKTSTCCESDVYEQTVFDSVIGPILELLEIGYPAPADTCTLLRACLNRK